MDAHLRYLFPSPTSLHRDRRAPALLCAAPRTNPRTRDSLAEAIYPPYFWQHKLAHLFNLPAHDHAPPYRDEQRAYLDVARELVPPHYGYKPTLRIDQWSVHFYSRDTKTLMEALLGGEVFQG